jgi:hypothetical protein
MTDFNDWYAQENPDLNPLFDHCLDELRRAYEAGAATQAETLRDHFAGQALLAIPHIGNGSELQPYELAHDAYKMAGAMLEARKTTGEGE